MTDITNQLSAAYAIKTGNRLLCIIYRKDNLRFLMAEVVKNLTFVRLMILWEHSKAKQHVKNVMYPTPV